MKKAPTVALVSRVFTHQHVHSVVRQSMIIVITTSNVILHVAIIRPVITTLVAKDPVQLTKTVNLTKNLIAVQMTSVNIRFSARVKNLMVIHVQVLRSVFLNIVTLYSLDAISTLKLKLQTGLSSVQSV